MVNERSKTCGHGVLWEHSCLGCQIEDARADCAAAKNKFDYHSQRLAKLEAELITRKERVKRGIL